MSLQGISLSSTATCETFLLGETEIGLQICETLNVITAKDESYVLINSWYKVMTSLNKFITNCNKEVC